MVEGMPSSPSPHAERYEVKSEDDDLSMYERC
jgi:hypothetical protein